MNNYKTVLTKELDVLMQWFGVEKKGMKKEEGDSSFWHSTAGGSRMDGRG